MADAPIMPFYTDAYLADTAHLDAEAHGAYLLLLLYCWRQNGQPIADDDQLLSRIARIHPKRWVRVVRPTLEPFFTRGDGFWRQKKLEKTWANVTAKRAQAKMPDDCVRRAIND